MALRVWACGLCTMENGEALNECQMCGGPRPAGVAAAPRAPAAAPAKLEIWNCAECTFENGSVLQECQMCGWPRPAIGGGGGGTDVSRAALVAPAHPNQPAKPPAKPPANPPAKPVVIPGQPLPPGMNLEAWEEEQKILEELGIPLEDLDAPPLPLAPEPPKQGLLGGDHRAPEPLHGHLAGFPELDGLLRNQVVLGSPNDFELAVPRSPAELRLGLKEDPMMLSQMEGLGWLAIPQVGIYNDPYEVALPLAVFKLPTEFRNVPKRVQKALFNLIPHDPNDQGPFKLPYRREERARLLLRRQQALERRRLQNQARGRPPRPAADVTDPTLAAADPTAMAGPQADGFEFDPDRDVDEFDGFTSEEDEDEAAAYARAPGQLGRVESLQNREREMARVAEEYLSQVDQTDLELFTILRRVAALGQPLPSWLPDPVAKPLVWERLARRCADLQDLDPEWAAAAHRDAWLRRALAAAACIPDIAARQRAEILVVLEYLERRHAPELHEIVGYGLAPAAIPNLLRRFVELQMPLPELVMPLEPQYLNPAGRKRRDGLFQPRRVRRMGRPARMPWVAKGEHPGQQPLQADPLMAPQQGYGGPLPELDLEFYLIVHDGLGGGFGALDAFADADGEAKDDGADAIPQGADLQAEDQQIRQVRLLNVVPHAWLWRDLPFAPEVNAGAPVWTGIFEPTGIEPAGQGQPADGAPARAVGGAMSFGRLEPRMVHLHDCRFSPNNCQIQLSGEWRDGYLQAPFPGAPELRHWLQVTRTGSRRCLSLHVLPTTPAARRLLRSATEQAATLGHFVAALRSSPEAVELRQRALRQMAEAQGPGAGPGGLLPAVEQQLAEQQLLLDEAVLRERERQVTLFGPLNGLQQAAAAGAAVPAAGVGAGVPGAALDAVGGAWRTPPDLVEPVGYRAPGVESLAQLLIRYCGPYVLSAP